jgi:uroporphyrinogen decarboxylase
VPERLTPIYEICRWSGQCCRQALLGFAGSPWTIATYMVAGEGSRDQHETRAYAYADRQAFRRSSTRSSPSRSITSKAGQCRGRSGQLFDSWAGSCPRTNSNAG